MSARKYIVIGRVQGVGFRWYVIRQGKSLGLTGWARNVRDGSVEVWAEGLESSLDSLESALMDGPSGAQVKEVQVETKPSTGRFNGFEITW